MKTRFPASVCWLIQLLPFLLLVGPGLANERLQQQLARIESRFAAGAQQPMRLIVEYEPPAGRVFSEQIRGQFRQAATLAGAEPLAVSGLAPRALLRLDRQQLQRLLAQGLVAAVHEDRFLRLSLQETLDQIDAELPHDVGIVGSGVAVAVLDTGVASDHSALVGRVVAEACFSTRDNAVNATPLCPGGNPGGFNGQRTQFGAGAATPCTGVSGCDHGTHVAGIVGAQSTSRVGVAPAADIIAVQVFTRIDNNTAVCGNSNPCLVASSFDVVDALDYVASIGPDFNLAAVNLSLGGGQYSSQCNGSPYDNAIDNLTAAGVVVVASSGNNGFTNAVSEPACVDAALSVGAVQLRYVSDGDDSVGDVTNNGVISDADLTRLQRYLRGEASLPSFAQADMNGDGVVDQQDHMLLAAKFSFSVPSWSNSHVSLVDLLAPGVSVTSTIPGNGWGSKSGTSMAAPHVAGAIALMRAREPGIPVTEIIARLTDPAFATSQPMLNQRLSPAMTQPGLDAGRLFAPRLNLQQPLAGTVLYRADPPLPLVATATDPQQGDLGAQVSWFSDLDGPLPAVIDPQTATIGLHRLNAQVVDSDGMAASLTTELVIAGTPDDMDDDGMPDQWEALYAIDDPAGDPDGDGFSNLQEYQLGMHPRDAGPVLQLLQPSSEFLFADEVNLQAAAMDAEDGNLSHAVQWSSSLQGELGTGSSPAAALQPGWHQLTLTVTDSAGQSAVANTMLEVGVRGDANLDLQFDVADLLLLSRHLSGAELLNPAGLLRVDVYPAGGDGVLDTSDWLLLQRYRLQ